MTLISPTNPIATETRQKVTAHIPFLEYLIGWEASLQPVRLAGLLRDAGGPSNVAVISVDMIKGFTEIGPLAGPRVAAIVHPVVQLVQQCHQSGVLHFVFLQDAHPQDSLEFGTWPKHCTEGSEEAQMVDHLACLPFSERFLTFPKKSVDGSVGTQLPAWLDAHANVQRMITVGNCTDICLYHLAMYLQTRAHAHGHEYRVTVPANCVATYDISVAAASSQGSAPHDGDLLHLVFLHQLSLHGVEVVRHIE